jgi:hypothetical protein
VVNLGFTQGPSEAPAFSILAGGHVNDHSLTRVALAPDYRREINLPLEASLPLAPSYYEHPGG